MSTFTVAGTSTDKGVTKVRFANDMLRVKVLEKNNHTNIDLIELKEPMTKEAIAAYLLQINFAEGDAVKQSAIEAELDKRTPKAGNKDAPKKETKKAPKPKAPKAITLDAIAAKAVKPTTKVDAELENSSY
jgi:hypothetical protein